MRFLAALLLFLAAPALAQTGQVLQSGKVTPGHASKWITNGVIGDAGGAAGGPKGTGLTELGITNTGLPECINSGPTTGPYYRLCFGANAGNQGLITYDALGGAPPQPLNCDVNGTITQCLGSTTYVSGLAFTGSNAGLIAIVAPPTSTQIVRGGFYATGDGGAAFYNFSTSPCSLNSGAGDNGSQVKPTTGTGCWLADFSDTAPPSVQVWGAKCDGSTDDTTVINAAVAYSVTTAKAIGIPVSSGGCYSTTGLDFKNATVVGAQPIRPTNPPGPNPLLACNPSIAGPCAIFGKSAGLLGGAFRDLAVKFTGTPVAGDQAIVIQGFNTTCSDVLAYNADDGFTWANGIASHCSDVFTWNILSNHLVDNGFPEVYLTSVRLGMNGAGDQASSNAFVKFTGANPSAFFCDQCQFNLGGVSPHYILDWESVSSLVDGDIKFTNWTVDMSLGNAAAVFHSDGSGGPFRLNMENALLLLMPHGTLFDLGGFAGLNQIHIANSNLYFNDAVAFPHVQYNFLGLTNVYFGGSGSVTIDGASNAIAALSNVGANMAITIQGGPWASLALSNIQAQSGYSDTAATGNVYASGVPPTSWTPQLTFAGLHAGMTGTSNGISSRQADGSIKETFGVALTAKGSSTGNAIITGSPYTCATAGYGGFANDVVPLWVGTLVGLTGAPMAMTLQNSAQTQLLQYSATALSPLTEANFANSSAINATVRCVPQ